MWNLCRSLQAERGHGQKVIRDRKDHDGRNRETALQRSECKGIVFPQRPFGVSRGDANQAPKLKMNNVSSQRDYFSQRMWRKRRAKLMDMFCEFLSLIVGGSGVMWMIYRTVDIVRHSPVGVSPILGLLIVGFIVLALMTYAMLKFDYSDDRFSASETKTVYF